MSKRFTDTDKYKKPFIRGLKGAYKLLWDYLYHDCNHAGIWIVDFDIAQIYLGADMLVNRVDALKYFNTDEERIIEFDDNKWFIPSFIEFQYGELNEKNRAHNSVINILNKNNLLKNKGLVRGLYDPKDKDKDMVIDKDTDILAPFNKFIEEVKRGEHSQSIELWYMDLKLKPNSLTDLLTIGFKAQLLTDNKLHNNTLELKKHFKSWLNVQDRVGRLNQYKIQKQGAL